VRRRTWKDELATLLIATGAQLLVLRAADWARANHETQELAASLVEYRFFFLPQILAVFLVLFVVRLIRSVLDFRGMRFADWIRSSAVLVGFGVAFVPVAHFDQILGFVGNALRVPSLVLEWQSLSTSPLYGVLQRNGTLRLGLDLVGVLVVLGALRFTRPQSPDVVAAREAARFGEFARSGDLLLKAGDVSGAKQMFRKGKAWARLAVLAERDGNLREAAALYEKGGDAFAWEASRAWEAAGDPERARALVETAMTAARAGARWDRLAEIAEATGDLATVAEACRRLAEAQPPGPVRAALWKRTAEAARAAGRPIEAAEAFRQAQDFQQAGEMYLEGSRPIEAIRAFERSGALDRAAVAAATAGDPRAAQELAARDAEARGDLAGAAQAWRKAGQVLRAAALFERLGEYAQAAEAWGEAERAERAAPLWEKAGELERAAAAWEAAGYAEKAASLYSQLDQFDKAAALFKTAGKLQLAAEALRSGGHPDEAAKLYVRVGRGLDAARCLLAAGRRDRAWEELVAVPRSEPGVAATFHDLAEAHLAVGEALDAVHVMRELLGRSPVTAENISYYKTLLRALREAGDPGESAEIARVGAFDPSVLEGRPSLPAAVGVEVPELNAQMPSALLRTPPAVNRTGARRVPIRPSGSTIPVHTTPIAPPAASATPLSAPEKPEERYEILAELGRGGMGVVHKALDRKLDRYVALKILPWQLRSDETAMRYFIREAKAIAALRHPNIVSLYDYGEGFGSLYLAMEFLEGPNLQKVMKTDSDRVKRSWREWFVQSARGIAAAHAKGILHRDLKPANLQLDEHEILRILDFGLALPQADAGGTSKLIGSPAFFPPEVLRGELPSPASDVYSLGAAFYTLATGRWPYVGDDVLVARLERDPDDPRPFAPFLTEPEVEVLLKCLARFRPDRYPDGGELLGALLAIEG
jgi:tetratricopeptide (TPR) repeat protein/predicted Ser/Thr protein kinase